MHDQALALTEMYVLEIETEQSSLVVFVSVTKTKSEVLSLEEAMHHVKTKEGDVDTKVFEHEVKQLRK